MDFLAMVSKTARFSKKAHGKDMELFENRPMKNRKRKVREDNSSDHDDDDDDEDDDEGCGSSSSDDEEDMRSWYKPGGAAEAAEQNDGKQKEGQEDQKDQDDPNFDASDPKQVARFRRKHKIRVDGQNVPPPIPSFEAMVETCGLPKPLLHALTIAKPPDGFGFGKPTPVQMQAISCMLARREVMAVAPTGSGKTVAFMLPLFCLLKEPKADAGVRAIVLAPTRELAQQIYEAAQRLQAGRKFRILNLKKSNANANAFEGASRDIVVTTPLRLMSVIEKKEADLSTVEHLVMDEADRLFDQGFLEQVDGILTACNNKHLRRHLFTATMSQGVEELARTVLTDPVRIVVGARNAATVTIDQTLVFTGDERGKLIAFKELVLSGLDIPALVFVQSGDRAQQLFDQLREDTSQEQLKRLRLGIMSSNLTPAQRTEAVNKFRMGETWVLICTDLMSRGIDFKGVNLVVNFDFPQSANSYIHRIGRTGRAGRKGKAITYFTSADTVILKNIAQVLRQAGCEVPQWMLNMPTGSKKRKVTLQDQAPARESISLNAKIKRLKRNAVVQHNKNLKKKQAKKLKQEKQRNAKRQKQA